MRLARLALAVLWSAAAPLSPAWGQDRSAILEDPVVFRQAVLDVVATAYPESALAAPADDIGVIVVDGVQLALQNIHAKFRLSDQSQDALEQIVGDHVSILDNRGQPESIPDYEEAKARIRIQLMPREYVDLLPPVISFPFSDDVAVGLVLDSERGYEYLTNDHAARWGVDAQELRRLATANLDAVSKEIAAQGIEKDDARAVVFATEDGYDAARILIPDLRAFIGTELGFPFLFAIPNRDFLICWTPGRSELDEFVRKQVREDYASMPYPLSSRIYRVTADNEIGQVD